MKRRPQAPLGTILDCHNVLEVLLLNLALRSRVPMAMLSSTRDCIVVPLFLLLWSRKSTPSILACSRTAVCHQPGMVFLCLCVRQRIAVFVVFSFSPKCMEIRRGCCFTRVSVPTGSLYGTSTYLYHKNKPNAGTYYHTWIFGEWKIAFFSRKFSQRGHFLLNYDLWETTDRT